MTLFTPIEMPSPLPVNSKVFDLAFQEDVSPVGFGFIQTIQRAQPTWLAKYTTPALSATRDQAFQAFLDTLEGSMGIFLGYDPRRPRPYAYRQSAGYAADADPWANVSGVAPNVATADFASRILHVTGLANGAQFTRGDYIAYKRGNAWYLHRLISNTVVSGTSADLSVSPRPLNSTTSVAARFIKAPAAMKVLGQVDKSDKVDDIGPTYSFSAVQFIDRST